MAAPSDYHRGDMDIAEQKSTFHGFIVMSKWGSLVLAVGVLFWTLLLCAKAGFFQSILASVVVTALGVFLLRDKADSGH